MKRIAAINLILAFFAGSIFSQTVNISGTVTDDSGTPLTNTVVRLCVTTYDNGYWAEAPYMAETDQDGHYHLGTGEFTSTISNNMLPKGEALARPTYSGGKVLFFVPANGSLVKMSLYDLSGRFIDEVMDRRLSRGSYSMSIDLRGISSQFYLLRVSVNGMASVLRLQPALRLSGGEVVRSASGYETRLEKTGQIVDTLRATEPGYTIGVMPISSLEGSNLDFVLTKNNTWDGDFDAFWGDTSTYPQAGSTPMYIILNRTNGAWPDDKISWSHGGNAPYVAISEQPMKPIESERMYVYVAQSDSNKRYFDFLEVNYGGGTWNGNSTRVDGWRLPITFRIKTTAGIDTVMGDSYHLYYQSRESKFEEFVNEVPQEFTHLATQSFAHIWAPHVCPVSYFNTGQKYVDYFKRYQDSVVINYVNDPTWTTRHVFPSEGDPGPMNTVPRAWDIFACTGEGGWEVSIGASPYWSAAMNRHVAHMEPHGIDWHNWGYTYFDYFYDEAPANFFSRWCHRRSVNDYCYGFPYDDNGDHQAFMTMRNIQWIAVAVGW